MTILTFAASPRRGGNTDILLDAAEAGVHDEGGTVERYILPDLAIAPCTGCGGCERTGCCVIQDDFTGVYERLVACDGMILAAPLYFMNVPSAAKAFIDRCQAFWAARTILGQDLFGQRRRAGLLISCAGRTTFFGTPDIFRGIGDTVASVYSVLGMTPQPSLLAPGLDTPGAVHKVSGLIERARNAGKSLASFVNSPPAIDPYNRRNTVTS